MVDLVSCYWLLTNFLDVQLCAIHSFDCSYCVWLMQVSEQSQASKTEGQYFVLFAFLVVTCEDIFYLQKFTMCHEHQVRKWIVLTFDYFGLSYTSIFFLDCSMKIAKLHFLVVLETKITQLTTRFFVNSNQEKEAQDNCAKSNALLLIGG